MSSGRVGSDAYRPAPSPGWKPGQAVALEDVVGDGRYVDATAIGTGRRGPTARARRRLDGAVVAVKVATRIAGAPERKAFPLAVEATAGVRSPNLVPILDHGVGFQGGPWLVTPWCAPGSVAERLAEGAWSVDDALDAARQMALGLAALHRAGIVHGNLTPPNLLYTEGGEVAVDGYALPGLAPRWPEGAAAAYVAPEVIGAGTYSSASDVWSFGSCVFAMLRGRPPWADAVDASAVGFMLAVSTKPPAPTRRADVPAWLDDLVSACLAVDPEDRPSSAEEVADRLTFEGGAAQPGTSLGLPAAQGRPLGSSYVLVAPIGSGTTGQVWRGERRGDRMAVAVKLLRPELSSEPEALARFLRERTTLVGLTHPNLVSVLDMVAEGTTLGIVMDLSTGKDLRKILGARGRIPPAEALRLVGQIADGVQAMHDAGLVHRDLKPENVLVEAGPRARVTDFGLARALSGTVLTRTEQLVGTADYLAPELVAGRPLTPAADVYSLGVVAYEMIAGHRPFEAEHPAAVLRSHLDTTPPRPEGWHDRVWDLVAMMLAKDPAGRPAAGDVAAYSLRLSEWLEGTASGALPAFDPPSAAGEGRGAGGEARGAAGEARGAAGEDPAPGPDAPALPGPLPPPSAPGSSAASGASGSAGEVETSFSLTPLPEAPPAPPGKGRGPDRRRRRRLIAGAIALLVLVAGGAGALVALLGRQKPAVTTLRPYDVTTSVTPAANGNVTVTWTPVQASTFIIAVSAGPVAQRSPAGVPDSRAGSYTVTGTPPGLHCFFAEAYFTGRPPRGLTRSSDTQKQCVTVR